MSYTASDVAKVGKAYKSLDCSVHSIKIIDGCTSCLLIAPT